MKEIIAREFIWLILAVVLAFPLAFVYLWLLGLASETTLVTQEEQEAIVELYLLGVLVSFIGVYLIRLIIGALGILVSRRRMALVDDCCC
ncbi:MAG: hypothetical protein AAF502_23460 [Bacteroidota bacterium]